ncbi:MAG TPA: hypothetical protein DEG96_09965 [Candidatus Atribacteria bacterium]|uniref:Glycosyl transferase group 1 n=1 Tax=candidate division TA06 bacterium 34_109 TaxID=1635277 RepID=A0A117M5Y8_UNCT6|nr:MAG: Glycosyl transferase group 1 [candidate division TA06 bacterium 34_109]HBY58159.1 hypothetical protein [Candidatus Atribacteria bacterium]
MMRVCFIADANSIHARTWIEYFCNSPDYEVFVLSTTRNPSPIRGVIIYDLKTSMMITSSSKVVKDVPSNNPLLVRRLIGYIKNTSLGKFFAYQVDNGKQLHELKLLYSVLQFRGKARAIIKMLQPDLIHCLRLPIEGYIGGLVGYCPFAISTWGNDLVYFAREYYVLRRFTRHALSIADLYFPDNTRDKYIAEVYGYSPSKLSQIIPGNGGLRLDEFPLHHKDSCSARGELGFNMNANLIISSRGFKNFYINTSALIQAIPAIIKIYPNTIFIIDGNTNSLVYQQLEKKTQDLKVERYCRFTNRLSRPNLLNYFAASDIMVSVTLYDGWPISLLEGMAYGLIPIMSNHSPIQEWVTDGWNGYLFDPRDPDSIAEAIIRALSNKDNFEEMRKRNWALLEERADYWKNMKIAEEMYRRVIGKK